MRSLVLSCTLLTTPVLAATVQPAALEPVFATAGIRLLCEQSAPLIQRGLEPAQQPQVSKLFDADALCDDLARRVAPQLQQAELEQVQALLDSPLAERFTAAERAVGEEPGGLKAYTEQLASRPPRAERVELVRQLDRQAHTSELATLLRYEAGKTQAWLSVLKRGQKIDEQTLTTQTAKQRESLQQSSQKGVEAFMLYAYRGMPSPELGEYVALYQQPAVKKLLDATLKALPEVFAAQRQQLK